MIYDKNVKKIKGNRKHVKEIEKKWLKIREKSFNNSTPAIKRAIEKMSVTKALINSNINNKKIISSLSKDKFQKNKKYKIKKA